MRVRDGIGMGKLGAEAENKHQTAFCGSAMRCHAWAARARLCSCCGKGNWRLSPSLISFTPTASPCRAAASPSACSCRWAGPGDQCEDHVLHLGGGTYRRCALPCTMTVMAKQAILSSHIWDSRMLCPGKGKPPELRRTYTSMPKGTRVPNVPLAWEGPRCPNHLEIPGPNSCTWALFPAAATCGSRVPEAAAPAQAQPKSPSQERRAAQLSQFRVENKLANANYLGQERRTFASKHTKQSHSLHANRHLSHPLTTGLSLYHSPLGRTNITVTAVVLFPE